MFLKSKNNNSLSKDSEKTRSSLSLSDDEIKGEEIKFNISEDLATHRLDFAISREIGLSRNYAQKLIKNGRVKLVPDRRFKPSTKLELSDIVSINMYPIETLDLVPEDIPFEVLYTDNDIIVINKPAGLVVHPSEGHWESTLVHGLLYKFPDIGGLNGVKRPGIVHRLDKTTSGLMVIARNGLAQEGLFRDFKARRVHKEYIALCYGVPASKAGEIRFPIARDPYNRTRMAVVQDGRSAWTDYSVIWSSSGYSLIRCILHTGRTHQLRVHMLALSCPIIGDKIYTLPKKPLFDLEDRVFLHSWKLNFKHPRSGKEMVFVNPLPVELVDFLKDISPKNHCQHS